MEIPDADQLLAQLDTSVLYRNHAPSMKQIAKISYTHDAAIDLIIAEPSLSQSEIAARFGYSQPWFCQVMASDVFQERLAARKNEIIDPALRLTIEERIKALTQRSVEILMTKLAAPVSQISDNLAIRAAEFGARSLGLGRTDVVKEAPHEDRLQILAGRLVKLKRQYTEVTYVEETVEGAVYGSENSKRPEVVRLEESERDKPFEGAV